jgi:hypothetical protein
MPGWWTPSFGLYVIIGMMSMSNPDANGDHSIYKEAIKLQRALYRKGKQNSWWEKMLRGI